MRAESLEFIACCLQAAHSDALSSIQVARQAEPWEGASPLVVSFFSLMNFPAEWDVFTPSRAGVLNLPSAAIL